MKVIDHNTTNSNQFKAPNLLATDGCQRPGTALVVWRGTECQTNAFLPVAVVLSPQAGSKSHIRVSTMAWYREQCVLTGVVNAVDGAEEFQ